MPSDLKKSDEMRRKMKKAEKAGRNNFRFHAEKQAMIKKILVSVLVVCMMKLLPLISRLTQKTKSKPEWFINSATLQITAQENLEDVYQIPFALLQDKLIQLKKYSQSVPNQLFIEQMTRYLAPPEREQLRKIGYWNKIQSVQNAVQINKNTTGKMVQSILELLHDSNKDQFEVSNFVSGFQKEISDIRQDTIKFQNSSITNDINDMWLHVIRETHPTFQNEVNPIKEFIQTRLNKIISIEKGQRNNNTLIVVPGCGVGGIPHFISTLYPYCPIDSIEYNTFKYLAQKYMYSSKQVDATNLGKQNKYTIAPFAMNYSNQINVSKQCQMMSFSDEISSEGKVNTICGDFNQYIPNDLNNDTLKYEKIVIVTVYFIDTAYNLLQYLASIEQLQEKSKTPIEWINIGPLKYGTQPLVQLTQQEFQKLRKLRGWSDVIEYAELGKENLNGYITNVDCLYQSYYQNLSFHSVFKREHH